MIFNKQSCKNKYVAPELYHKCFQLIHPVMTYVFSFAKVYTKVYLLLKKKYFLAMMSTYFILMTSTLILELWRCDAMAHHLSNIIMIWLPNTLHWNSVSTLLLLLLLFFFFQHNTNWYIRNKNFFFSCMLCIIEIIEYMYLIYIFIKINFLSSVFVLWYMKNILHI